MSQQCHCSNDDMQQWLRRVERKLDIILIKEYQMAANDSALFDSMTALNGKLDAIKTAVLAIEALGAGAADAAVQAEVDKIKAALDLANAHADDVVAAANAGLPAAPVDTPPTA